MTTYVIRPFLGVGKINFGDSPARVRTLLGAPFEPCQRHAADCPPTDYFVSLGVFAYYNPSGKLDAMEFAEPAKPIFAGCSLLGVSYGEAKAFIEKFDPNAEVDGSGMTAYAAGVGLYAPFGDEEPEEISEGAIAFVPEHYKAGR